MNNNYENIVPWNGGNDTGRDVRLKLERNFQKIAENFSELVNQSENIDELLGLIADELEKKLRKDGPDSTQFVIEFLNGLIAGDGDAFIAASGDAEFREILSRFNIVALGDVSGNNIIAAESVEGKNVNATNNVKATHILAEKAVIDDIVTANEVNAYEKVLSQTIEATGQVKGQSLTATETLTAPVATITDKTTTLNLLVQKLAEIHTLDVSGVATLFRTIIKDYLSSETFIPGFAGEGMKLYKAIDGDWNIEIDHAVIRKTMTVFELIISKIRAVNGALVISPANGKIKTVSQTTTYYDLELEDENTFVKDDLVRCQTFTGNNIKSYWVPVYSIASGKVRIKKTDFSGILPEPGDELVLMGNRTDPNRQSLLYLTAQDGKPRIQVLDGVNSTTLTGKNKTILGSLEGVTDTTFPADAQPSGYGLWSKNVFLKGVFILRNGKTIEDQLTDQITTVETAFEIREGQISAKVREATTAATTATQKAGEASTSATAASGSATNAKKSADDAAAKLVTITEKESSITQTAGEIATKVTEVTTKATQAATSATAAAGSATNAKKSADDAAAKLVTITQKESSITQTAGEIATKVTEVNTKATQTAASATAAAGSATNAKKSADDAAAKLTTITQKESSINQKADEITLKVTEVNTKASQAATNATNAANSADIAMAMSKGKMLYRDPSFKVGVNSIKVYNNSGNGLVKHTRISGLAGNPNNSGYALKIESTGTASPGFGGFSFQNNVRANAVFVVRLIALIPAGRTLTFATNALGTGSSHKWLTSNKGTDTWQEYAYKIVCGNSGTFSTTSFFYLSGGTTPTTAVPLTWYLAYATVFDVTDAEIDYIADAADKYTTKTEHSTSITQLSDKIELRATKTDLNALNKRVSTAETTITQHTSQIALKASQTDFNALGNRVSEAELKITPGAIQSAVKSQTESLINDTVNNIQVGGRNIALSSNSSKFSTYSGSTIESQTTGVSVPEWKATDANRVIVTGGTSVLVAVKSLVSSLPPEGSVFTQSGWFKNNSTTHAIMISMNSGAQRVTLEPGEARRIVYEGNIQASPNTQIQFQIRSASVGLGVDFTWWRCKVEYGNKVTDWTPAPEDVEADATKKANDAKAAAIADAASKYTTKTEHSTSITQLSDKIELRATKTDLNALNKRVSTAETTITQHTNQIALKASQSDFTALGKRVSEAELKITPAAINATVKSQTETIATAAVDALEIGGRNLLLNSRLQDTLTKWTNTGSFSITTEDNIKCVSVIGALATTKHLRQSIAAKLEANQVYTVSAWCKVKNYTPGTTNNLLAVYFSGKDSANAALYATNVSGNRSLARTTWTKIEYTLKFAKEVTSMSLYLYARDFTGTLYIHSVKLEKGNKASDWTPAPEDLETTVTELEARFEIRENEISSKVTQATTSATNASASASNASSKATAAGGSATAAAGSASTASSKATEAASSATAAAGSATNAKKSADDAAAKLTTITQKESSINQKADEISLKVTEVNTKATAAASSATAAAGSASTASSKATAAASSATAASGSASNAKKSADDAAAKLTTITQKESSINQTASNITLQVTEVTTRATEASDAAQLASAMSKGKMLYRDPTFASGVNSTKIYGSNVALTRVTGITGNPNSNGYCIKIVTTAASNPGFGGFSFQTPTRANAVFVTRIIANIPVGRNLVWKSNQTGTERTQKWLTPVAGTGNWEEYAFILNCGSTGTFSTTNFFYISGGATPTAAAPLTWYLAYATVFDVTDVDDIPSREEIKAGINIDANQITIFGKALSLAGKITFSSLDSAAQSKINTAQTTANTANTGLTNLKNSLKSLAYLDTIEEAKLGTTIIEGGYLKTKFINVDELTVKKISAAEGTFNHIEGTSGNDKMILSPNLIRFTNQFASVHMGADTSPASSGGTFMQPIRISLNRVLSTYSAGANAGITLSVSGAKSYDDVTYTGNHALYISQGDIQGFRLRTRRISKSQTLTVMDSIILVIASGVTITLPSNAEDGQLIWIRNIGSGSYTVKAPTGQYVNAAKGKNASSFSSDSGRTHVVIYDIVNKTWHCNWYNAN